MQKMFCLFFLLLLSSTLVFAREESVHDAKMQSDSRNQKIGQKAQRSGRKSDRQKQQVNTSSKQGVQKQEPDLFLIDTINAVIFGQEDTEVITQSDAQRVSLTGNMRSLDDIVFEGLVFLDAKKHKILPDDDMVDRYLVAIQRENNMKPGDLDMLFAHAGYTYQEGREQLKIMQAVNSMLDFKIRSNLIVSRKDIEQYYHEHPQIQEASYYLQYVVIPFSDTKTHEEQEAELKQFAMHGKGLSGIAWSESFWVNKSDIAQGKDFLFTMKSGDISVPVKTAVGFELYYLKDKKEERARSLDDMRHEIVDILRRPKYVELLNEYKTTLFDASSILYL